MSKISNEEMRVVDTRVSYNIDYFVEGGYNLRFGEMCFLPSMTAKQREFWRPFIRSFLFALVEKHDLWESLQRLKNEELPYNTKTNYYGQALSILFNKCLREVLGVPMDLGNILPTLSKTSVKKFKNAKRFLRNGEPAKSVKLIQKCIRELFSADPVFIFRTNRMMADLYNKLADSYEKLDKHFEAFIASLSAFECIRQGNVDDFSFMYQTQDFKIYANVRQRFARISTKKNNLPMALFQYHRVTNCSIIEKAVLEKAENEEYKIGVKLNNRKENILTMEKIDPKFSIPVYVSALEKIDFTTRFKRRKFYTANYHSGKLYIFGGVHRTFLNKEETDFDDEYLDDFGYFDIEKNSYYRIIPKSKLPNATAHHVSVVFKDSIFYYGGENTSLLGGTSVWRYNILKNKFVKLQSNCKFFYHAMHSACVWKKYMIVYGGINWEREESVECGDVLAFNMETCEWETWFDYEKFVDEGWHIKGQVPRPRFQAGMWIQNEKLYVLGGNIFRSSKNFKPDVGGEEDLDPKDMKKDTYTYRDLWSFDLSTGQWEYVYLIGNVMGKRAEFAPLVWKDRVYVFGGFGHSINYLVRKQEKVNLLCSTMYYNDCFQLSIKDKMVGNEIFGHNRIYDHLVLSRKLEFLEGMDQWGYARTDVKTFVHKNQIYLFGGYRLSENRKKLINFTDLLKIRFENENFNRECTKCMRICEDAKKCSRCGESFYCNRECQKRDWAWHKTVCTPITKLSENKK